jgi:hypothetical protein
MEYKKNGIDVKVLSFNAKESYIYDAIEVISYNDFMSKYNKGEITLIISHAPNLRNHIRFLTNKNIKYKNLIFFFHGHEVLIKSKYYPKPYSYVKSSVVKHFINDVYDHFKLPILKKFIEKKLKEQKLKLVFVSEWMRNTFLENININPKIINANSLIIHNSMNSVFMEKVYKQSDDLYADFVTIRPLDNSKYCIDLVVKLANKFPELTFHIYGKGDYFNYCKKPDNLKVFYNYFTPTELAGLLNHYKCSLMPTRLDAQGVMMCEIATYGMPIITSDLPICKEMLSSFKNVFFMNNEELNIDLNDVISSIRPINDVEGLKKKFSYKNTIQKEISLIRENI